MKPFECVGSVDELRFAYQHRVRTTPAQVSIPGQNPIIPTYADLPFAVPTSHFDYAKENHSQPFFRNFFEDHRQ